MSSRLKNRILLSTVLLMLIPFMLLTDLFPLLRFGMFAEPVKKQVQSEVFVLLDKTKGSPLNPNDIGFHGSSFQYLARNYYYRKETVAFLEKISRIGKDSSRNLSLVRISFPPGLPEKADTIYLGSINKKF